jgi:hypothetical protein
VERPFPIPLPLIGIEVLEVRPPWVFLRLKLERPREPGRRKSYHRVGLQLPIPEAP